MASKKHIPPETIQELIPLLCDLDHVMIYFQHGVLHRQQTFAGSGEFCDYFITGDKEFPNKGA